MEYHQLLIRPPSERHWQNARWSLKRGFSNFIDPLSPDELAGLAMESEIDKADSLAIRMAMAGQPAPFSKATIIWVRATGRCWCTGGKPPAEPYRRVDAPVPRLPDWRIDDPMISFSVPGGALGPHLIISM